MYELVNKSKDNKNKSFSNKTAQKKNNQEGNILENSRIGFIPKNAGLKKIMDRENPPENSQIDLNISQRSLVNTIQNRTNQQRLNNPIMTDNVIQCSLDKLDESLTSANTFNGLITTYNEEELNEKKLVKLEQLDQAIYNWFKINVNGKISNTNEGTRIQNLLRDSEKEHIRLTKIIIRAGGSEDGKLFHQLYDAREEGGGENYKQAVEIFKAFKIKENTLFDQTASNDFKDKIYSSIVKLILKPSGRRLVWELLNSQGKQFIFKESSGSSGFNPKGGEPNIKKIDEELHGQEIAKYEDMDISNFRDFLIKLGPGKYFKFKNNIYKTGTGSGGDISINFGSGAKPLLSEGLTLKETITPMFVTLAHEMGHAINSKYGIESSKIGLQDFGIDNINEKVRWDDSEEFVNISQVENKVREEHGIGKRKWHEGNYDKIWRTDCRNIINPVIIKINQVNGDFFNMLTENNKVFYDIQFWAQYNIDSETDESKAKNTTALFNNKLLKILKLTTEFTELLNKLDDTMQKYLLDSHEYKYRFIPFLRKVDWSHDVKLDPMILHVEVLFEIQKIEHPDKVLKKTEGNSVLHKYLLEDHEFMRLQALFKQYLIKSPPAVIIQKGRLLSKLAYDRYIGVQKLLLQEIEHPKALLKKAGEGSLLHKYLLEDTDFMNQYHLFEENLLNPQSSTFLRDAKSISKSAYRRYCSVQIKLAKDQSVLLLDTDIFSENTK